MDRIERKTPSDVILIADSGSTKTCWAVVDHDTLHRSILTQGLNPYFTPAGQLRDIIHEELVHNLIGDDVSEVFFYGAGCSTETNNKMVEEAIRKYFRLAKIYVFHDILGAARALFGHEQGIACILGTGCNACHYDGTDVYSRVPSLGYLFGDEGAGSYIGKALMGSYLKDNLPPVLKDAFHIKHPFSLEEILNNLYNKPFPNRFLASFSPFVYEHRSHPFIQDILYRAFDDFVTQQIMKYENFRELPIGFAGSIAFYYHDFLREVMSRHGIRIHQIQKNPMEGLVRFHAES